MKKKVRRNIKRVAVLSLMLGMIVASDLSKVKAYATSYDYYLYYVNSGNKFTQNTWRFAQYGEHTYYAIPSTSTNAACALVQAGPKTTLEKVSYVVSSPETYVKQTSASGDYAWLVTKLSYNTTPASTSGTLKDIP